MKEIKLIMERWKKFLLQEFDFSPIITAGPKMSDAGYEPPSAEAIEATINSLKSAAAGAIEVVDTVDTAGTVVAVYLSGGTLLPVMISKQGTKQILKQNLLNALKSTSPKNITRAVKQKFQKKNPNLPDLNAPASPPRRRPTVTARQDNFDDINKGLKRNPENDPRYQYGKSRDFGRPFSIDDAPTPAPKIKLNVSKKSKANSEIDPLADTGPMARPDNKKTVVDGPPEPLVGPKPRKTKSKGSKPKDRKTKPQGSK